MRSYEAYAVVYLDWAFQFRRMCDPASTFATKMRREWPLALTLGPKNKESVWGVGRVAHAVLSAEAAGLK